MPFGKFLDIQYSYSLHVQHPRYGSNLVMWIYTRHYLLIVVMINIITEPQKYLPIRWDPATGYFVSETMSRPTFLTFFVLLEILQIFWLMSIPITELTRRNILKLIYRQLFKGQTIGDDRSCRDDEDDSK